MNKYIDFLASFGIGAAHPGGIATTKEIIETLNINHGDNILDVGCGTGVTSSLLKRECHCNVTAIDVHPDMITHAKRRFEKEGLDITLALGNAENLSFPDNTFDYIIAESVTVFTDIEKTIAEFFRVLKPGGSLIDIELTVSESLSQSNLEEIKSVYGLKHVPTKKDWLHLFKDHSFKVIDLPLNQSSEQDKNTLLDGSEIQFSPTISLENMETWLTHQVLKEKYKGDLHFSIFKAVK